MSIWKKNRSIYLKIQLVFYIRFLLLYRKMQDYLRALLFEEILRKILMELFLACIRKKQLIDDYFYYIEK